jgi:hypothetical protein
LYGVTQEQICSTLGVSGTDDIGLEKLVTLRGILTAIKEGDTTPEQAFANADLPPVGIAQVDTLCLDVGVDLFLSGSSIVAGIVC